MVSTRHLYIGDTDISHLCHNALCIRVDHLLTEPHKPMNERIKGASHDNLSVKVMGHIRLVASEVSKR